MSGQPRMATATSCENRDLAGSSCDVQLSVRGLSKAFHGLPAIDDIDFTASRHEFVAVLGPSGAGKTTLFRCITGLLAADQGTVRIGMSEVTSVMTRRLREVAVIFQQFNLVNRLTALENVLAGRLGYVPAWRGWLRRFDRSDRLLALECLDRVGLMDLAMRRADTLSGGQQQRVAIARARPGKNVFKRRQPGMLAILTSDSSLHCTPEVSRGSTTAVTAAHNLQPLHLNKQHTCQVRVL